MTIREANADGTGLVQVRWGTFVQTVINFLIIAFSLFVVVKVYDRLTVKAERSE
ncbi:MAG: MscL family protein [Candidatus Kapaibacteriota bacterium]